jgi:dephospho-CoA kinase
VLGGGIGSGKTAAAAVFAQLGATVISADETSHGVLGPGEPASFAVAERWPEVVSADGVVDRSALARIVFDDPAELRRLERITHPVIVARMADLVAAAADDRVVIVEIPLPGDWLGAGWTRLVVDAPDEIRVRRLLARGMTLGEIRLRMSVQPNREQWLGAADHVIDNGGDLERLEAECRRVWEELLSGGTRHTPR